MRTDRPADPLSKASTRRWVLSVEAAALAGLVHSVAMLTGRALLVRVPTPGLGDPTLASWYLDPGNQRSTLAGVNAVAISTIAFLWFIAVVRRRVGERENRFFGTVFLGSALLLAGSWLMATMLYAAPTLSAYMYGIAPDPADASLWQAAGVMTASVLGTRLEAVFIISSTTVGRLGSAFAPWLVLIGYGTGVTLLLAPLPNEALTWIFPSWVIIVSVNMLVRRHRVDRPRRAVADTAAAQDTTPDDPEPPVITRR